MINKKRHVESVQRAFFIFVPHLHQIFLKPLKVALHCCELHFWLDRAMRLAGKYDHSGRDALLLKGVVKLVALRDRNADVGVTLGIYAHVLPGDDEDAARRADELLDGESAQDE